MVQASQLDSEISARLQEQDKEDDHCHNDKCEIPFRNDPLDVVRTLRGAADNSILSQKANTFDNHIVPSLTANFCQIADLVNLDCPVACCHSQVFIILRGEAGLVCNRYLGFEPFHVMSGFAYKSVSLADIVD